MFHQLYSEINNKYVHINTEYIVMVSDIFTVPLLSNLKIVGECWAFNIETTRNTVECAFKTKEGCVIERDHLLRELC